MNGWPPPGPPTRFLSETRNDLLAGIEGHRRRRRRRDIAGALTMIVIVLLGSVVLVRARTGDEGGQTVVVDPGTTATTTPPSTTTLPAPVPVEGRLVPDGFVTSSSTGLFPIDDDLLVVDTQSGGTEVRVARWRASDGSTEAKSPTGLVWRYAPAMGWTGTELLMVGGSNGPGLDQVAVAYDPQTDRWRPLPDPPGHSVDTPSVLGGPGFWTGEELLVPAVDLAFDPETERWRSTAPSPLAERSWATMTWTGDRLFVWGGCFEPDRQCDESNSGLFNDGALYDPDSDTWATVATSPLPPAVHVEAGWTGSEVVMAVTEPAPGSTGPTAAAYNPASDTWRVLPDLPLSPRRFSASTVADGRLVVWGGTPNMDLATRRNADGAILDPASGTWSRFSVDMAFAREYPTMAGVSGVVYVTGGRPDARPFTFTMPDRSG